MRTSKEMRVVPYIPIPTYSRMLWRNPILSFSTCVHAYYLLEKNRKFKLINLNARARIIYDLAIKPGKYLGRSVIFNFAIISIINRHSTLVNITFQRSNEQLWESSRGPRVGNWAMRRGYAPRSSPRSRKSQSRISFPRSRIPAPPDYDGSTAARSRCRAARLTSLWDRELVRRALICCVKWVGYNMREPPWTKRGYNKKLSRFRLQ